MISPALLKPILGIAACIGTLITGSSLAISAKKPSTQNRSSSAASKAVKDEVEDIAIAFNAPSLPKYNEAVLELGWYPNENSGRNGEKQVKCQIENTDLIQYCSLAKFTLPGSADKKWIDYAKYKTFPYNSIITDDFITENKTIYKVRLSGDLIYHWQTDNSRKLKIYANTTVDANTKPLTTLIPKFAIKNNDAFRGSFQHLFVKASTLNLSGESFNASGKSFKCKFSVTGGEYKNCQIYLFDEAQSTATTHTDRNIKIPFTAATSVKKDAYYIIKFDEKVIVNDSKYQASSITVDVQAYSNSNRQQRTSSADKDITFDYQAPIILFGNAEEMDVALVLK